MPDQNTLIAASAFSGLAGALLTQALSGTLSYFTDKRRSHLEVKNQYRNKQVEIAETYYFVAGETMNILKKSVRFWKNRHDARGDTSLSFMQNEIKKTSAALDRLMADNWRHNLISLYFNVSLSHEELIASNTKSHELYLKILDIADQIALSDDNERDDLYGRYNLGIFDLCRQYDQIYDLLALDMQLIREALRQVFET